mgnify:FL=1
MANPVRTRFAPSPTGYMHVGNLRTALYTYLQARHNGGTFILRIEDTDQGRLVEGATDIIYNTLRATGLTWDEGPDIGGPHAPYRQSERMGIYRQYALELVEKGHAFYCFATAEELDQMRAEQQARGESPRYDGRGLNLAQDEVERRLAAGEAHVIRMKVPAEGVCKFNDMLRGEVEIPWAQVDMQILLKTDGLPTYHLANVVDDHLMEITHVIRGEEWIPSAPKHQLLYQYFGWEMPALCHMPLLRNPDKSKLSKRKNPTSINYYKDIGVLPEALLNYLGRMGWSMPDESEKFTLAEMVQHFDIQRVSLGGPIFDVEKLNWLNGQWIKGLTPAELLNTLLAWKSDRQTLEDIAAAIQPRINLLSEAVNWAGFYFNQFPALSKEQFESKKLSEEQVRQSLQFAIWRLESLFTWNNDTVSQTLMDLANQMEIKLRDFMPAFFIAIAGSTSSTPVMQSMVTIGPDLTFARLRHALEIVGGPSKKEAKVWEKLNESLKLPKNDAVDSI